MLSLVKPAQPSKAVSGHRQYRSDKGAISFEKVMVQFGSANQLYKAVEETTLSIPPGQFVCILGPSGCGKSTLLNSLAGYVKSASGRVLVDGESVRGPGPDRGMVFQQYSLFPWKTVRQNVAFGPRMVGSGETTPESVADLFIDMVGLTKFADRYPRELSGGMQQRVGIARALATYPRVLLMDEPFGALDSQTRHVMQENLLKIWSEFGTTVLFVTHDIDEAVFLADRVLVMSAAPGRIIADIAIDLPRPRDSDLEFDERFLRYRRQCHELIRAESRKAFAQQNH
jgi:NitT/TauT family transport system ATP-binding protein